MVIGGTCPVCREEVYDSVEYMHHLIDHGEDPDVAEQRARKFVLDWAERQNKKNVSSLWSSGSKEKEIEEYEKDYLKRLNVTTDEDNTKETSMFCENCGASLKPTAKFCGKCGTART